MDILSKIDKLRNERGWSFYELSEQSSVNQSTLANMYRRKSLPSIQTLTDLCKAFEITLSQFFAEEQNDINNEKTRLLINNFNSLNEQQKNFVLEMTNLVKKNLQ